MPVRARVLACAVSLATATLAAIAGCEGARTASVPPAAWIPVAPSPHQVAASAPADVLPPLAGVDASDGAALDDPMAGHATTRDALLGVLGDPSRYSPFDFDVGQGHINQGNRAVAKHAITRSACLKGLSSITLQTPEQRARCGAENMVPVFGRGEDEPHAKFCIDLFEFPNRACELPIVWISPSVAERVCRAEGKRLCDQEEWKLACRADPAGGKDLLYAYGDELDLTICNTNKSRRDRPVKCGLQSLRQIWDTCTTDTEPTGSYPRCRSRFGVFDMHGNVAEIMTRKDWDGLTYSQLKGSAFHYVDVAKRPQEGLSYYERYPDHCNFDPRWHVEKIGEAAHSNYHLGFRCCKSLER